MRHEHVLTMKTRRRSLMKRHWTNEELAEHWILSSKELDLIGDSKTDHNLLGAACLLKYFQFEGRFPAQKQDIPPIVTVHLAQQLGVVPEKIIPYDWEGRGKCPMKWTDLARQHGILPSILDIGTHVPGQNRFPS